MRSGLVAEKLGMTRLFDATGKHIPVTVLKVQDCVVVAVRKKEKDGYDALQLGADKNVKPKNVNKPQRGVFAKSKVELRRRLVEFRISADAALEVGTEIQAAHFVEGQYVDAQGTTIGKGFAGAMKRHNFAGLEATHGVSISHRSHGSTGQCQDPGKVFKGKKMAGHMGDVTRTVQNLKVVKVDNEQSLIYLKGAVPGKGGAIINLTDSVKRALPDDVPFPTYSESKDVPSEEQSVEVVEEVVEQVESASVVVVENIEVASAVELAAAPEVEEKVEAIVKNPEADTVESETKE
jgi:large subunit ribosomal protein L3